MLILLLKGFIIGFAIAAPVGPIGILCFQRSLHDGFRFGVMTGLGAALADGTYCLVVSLGLTVISSSLMYYQPLIRVIGGLFLVYLGLKVMFKSTVTVKYTDKKNESLLHTLTASYLLTLTNPATILSLTAVFAGLGLATSNLNFTQAMTVVIGVIIGSAICSLLLSGSAAFIMRKHISLSFMRISNLISGSILLTFGLFALKILI